MELLLLKRIKRHIDKIIPDKHIKELDKKLEEVKEETPKEVVAVKTEKDIMMSIESKLKLLSETNNLLFIEYNNEYRSLVSGGENTFTFTPLSRTTLLLFEGKLDLALKAKKDDTANFTNYLESLKNNYLANVLLNENDIKCITLEEINQLSEEYIQNQNKYSFFVQARIKRDITLIYVLEIYRNRECISEFDLTNTYFEANLNEVTLILKSMISLGIINDNIISTLDETGSLSSVLSLIKNLEFNHLEQSKAKELIRKI